MLYTTSGREEFTWREEEEWKERGRREGTREGKGGREEGREGMLLFHYCFTLQDMTIKTTAYMHM